MKIKDSDPIDTIDTQVMESKLLLENKTNNERNKGMYTVLLPALLQKMYLFFMSLKNIRSIKQPCDFFMRWFHICTKTIKCSLTIVFSFVIILLSSKSVAQGTISRPIVEGYPGGPSSIASSPIVAANLWCSYHGLGEGGVYTVDTGLHPVYRYTCNDGNGTRGNPTWRLSWNKRCSVGFGIWPPEAASPDYVGGECIGGSKSFVPDNYDNTCTEMVGNPIAIALAEKIQTESDFVFLGYSPLLFSRHYNSGVFSSQGEGSLGNHWLHNFDRRIVAGNYESSPSGVEYWHQKDGRWVPVTKPMSQEDPLSSAPTYAYVVRSNGKSIYHHLQNGQWQTDYGIGSTLTQVSDNQGWLFITNDNTKETYDIYGRLKTIETTKGQLQNLFYELTVAEGGDDNPSTLDRVNDNRGNFINFYYNSTKRLSRVTTSFDETFVYNYDAQKNLSSVIYPGGDSRHYHYENIEFPQKITGITNEQSVRYATWTYDDRGRAITSEHADGTEKSVLDYTYINDPSQPRVTVTNALGKQTTYHYTTIHGVRKVTQVEGHPSANCAGANQAYTYDTNGFMASKTDWEGNVTTYIHNDRGQEISRTEASGTSQSRTITTEWHEEFNLPIKIIEPKRETVMSYNAQGQLLSTQIQKRVY